ncbi:MAG: PAS domain S-box protein, partial [Kaistella sp.]
MKNFLLNNLSLDSLTTLFSQAPVALAMLMGEEQVIEVANEQILDLWGKDERVLGLPLLEALPEIKDQEFPQILKGVYKTGVAYKGNGVLAMLVKNGVLSECYFDFVYSPIFINDEITGISVVATEVTEKVLSEKKLQESELRFKELMEISDYSTGIYVGEDLIIDFANDQMIKTWGKDKSVIGKKLEDALPELQGQPFIQILKNIFKTGEAYIAQEDRVDLVVDGELKTFYYNFSYKPLRDANGDIYGIMNVAMNVSELVSARKRAEASEVEYRNLAEAMPQIVWTSSDGKFDYFNRNLLELLNCKEEEVHGFNFEDIVHPDDLPHVKKRWEETLQHSRNFELEYRIKDSRTGEYIWFLNRATPVTADGEVVKWIGTSTNI